MADQFQSTRPRGARPSDWPPPLSYSVFQSTRPHGARLFVLVKDATGQGVSIHAPAWGATAVGDSDREALTVSIHAPAWGATGLRPEEARELDGFNPRARVGRDVTLRAVPHTFTWFQSTRPRGARHDAGWLYRRIKWGFNPRARVGRDFSGRSWSRSWACFNPRARVGRDGVEAHAVVIPVAVSIHVPAWGATVVVPRL